MFVRVVHNYLSGDGADMEGIAGVCAQRETNKDVQFEYAPFRDQMTAEVAAACTSAYSAGIDSIVVKDAHWTGRNIDPQKLHAPDGKSLHLIRGWSGHPFAMVQGIDKSFDAAAFIGYHSAGGTGGNPLAHTISGASFFRVEINDAIASEFLIYAYAAASVCVPVVFLSGDRSLCEEAGSLIDGMVTVPILEGVGASVVSIMPADAIRLIQAGITKALTSRRPAVLALPKHFSLKITFAKPSVAHAKSFYPQARQLSDTEVLFETTEYFDVLAFLWYAASAAS